MPLDIRILTHINALHKLHLPHTQGHFCAFGWIAEQYRIMYPGIGQLIQHLQWHASVEGESLDAAYCESLNPAKVLAKTRRRGLQIEGARAATAPLSDATIGDSTDTDAPPLLVKRGFRSFSFALWDAFSQEVRPISPASMSTQHQRFSKYSCL